MERSGLPICWCQIRRHPSKRDHHHHHHHHHHHQWLYSPSGPWPPLLRYLNHILRHTVGLPGRVISRSQGLYLHRTTQHRKTKGKHPSPERDSNPRTSVRAPKLHASDRTVNGSANENRSGLKSGNACHDAVQYLLSSRLQTFYKKYVPQIHTTFIAILSNLLLVHSPHSPY
jgi:hypothetical protein